MFEYKRAFVALRKDPKWRQKFALGVLISLIPYVGMAWMLGWQMEYQRNVAWGRDEVLPEWSSFSKTAWLGLKAYIAILPYSFVLGLVVTPVSMAGPLLGMLATDGTAMPMWLGAAVGFGVSFLAVMALSLLAQPLTASVMLRVALCGSIESGFEFREIWRLLRENGAALRRAWGFSVINSGISFIAMAFCFIAIGLTTRLISGSGEQQTLAMFAVWSIGCLVYCLLALPLGMYLGLMNMHHFGSYGRVAYNLEGITWTPVAMSPGDGPVSV